MQAIDRDPSTFDQAPDGATPSFLGNEVESGTPVVRWTGEAIGYGRSKVVTAQPLAPPTPVSRPPSKRRSSDRFTPHQASMSWALIPLTEEQRAIQQTARDFAHAELAPYSEQWDREGFFDRAVAAKLGALGFLGMLIPEEYDGLGLDTCTYLVALEEIAAVDASIADNGSIIVACDENLKEQAA